MSSESVRTRVGLGSPKAPSSVGKRNNEWRHTDPTTLLDTLGDEYARAALEAVLDRPRSGREVAAATDMSRSTAFRRLNTLVELGLLETDQRIDVDEGHHHKEYRPVLDSFAVTIDDGKIEVILETDHPAGSGMERPVAIPAND